MVGVDKETKADGLEEPEEQAEDTWERNLGPDERDRDLMDGSWEAKHYANRQPKRDWKNVQMGLAIFVLLSLVVPLLLTVVRL